MKAFYRIDTTNKTVEFEVPYGRDDIVRDIRICDRESRWNPELKVWIVPVNDFSKSRILDVIQKHSFMKQVEIVESDAIVDYETNEIDYAYLRGLCDAKDFAYTPRQYQLEALGYALEHKNIINGDDVGLGKTFESIMYTEVINAFPCIVVTPASVKYNWQEKWLEITKNRTTVAVIESKETKKHQNDWSADVIIINYDIISKRQGTGSTFRFPELGRDWKMAIFDEGHFVKEKASNRSKISLKIASKSERVQLLSGTIASNKPIELWNPLVLIRQNKAIVKDWQSYIYRYCGGFRSKFGWYTKGATKMLELNKRLRKHCYIRREKRDVMDELPKVTQQIFKIPITNASKYRAATDNLIQYLKDNVSQEKADQAAEAEHLVLINTLRTLAIEGKMKAIIQYLKDWQLGEKGKLVVFGLHREQLIQLAETFNCELIAGGVSAKKKQEIVKRFQTNNDLFLFANMQSAGTGIDGLQLVSSNELILELPWRPADMIQAIGRIDRSGQTEPVTITIMLSYETIDKQMWEWLLEKEAITEAINKGVDIKRSKSGMREVIAKLLNEST